MNEEKTNRSETALSVSSRLEIIQEGIQKSYLTRLDEMEIAPFSGYLPLEEDLIENVRLYKISEIIYQKGEPVHEKLTTVFNTLSPFPVTLFLILDSDGLKTDFYLGIRNDERNEQIKRSTVSLADTLKNALSGHFPGIQIARENRKKIAALSQRILEQPNLASVSVLADLKTDQNSEHFEQGMEKLVRAMDGRSYTAIIVAQNRSSDQIQQLRAQYMDLYTKLSPYQKIQTSDSKTTGTSRQKSFAEMDNKQKAAVIGSAITSVAGAAIGAAFPGGQLGPLLGSQVAGQLNGLISSLAPSQSVTESDTKGFTSTTENKMVTEILKDLDEAIQQTYLYDSFGMWNTAAYFLSDNMSAAEIASSNFRSLMNGEKTGKRVSAINLWRWNDPLLFGQYSHLTSYLSRFSHPQFRYGSDGTVSIYTDPGVTLSGKEIGVYLGLPRTSVAGLPVLEHAEFGKEVVSTSLFSRRELRPEERLSLGRVLDLGMVREKPVELSNDSLNMHTFITGSTGSGKSNTVYQMLYELSMDDIPFLVIEPAKGEYKDVFGSWPSVNVYSTNPKDAELIHLNPFQFPDSVHVLEHIDGLTELFSACWPMYDAMPAFFKSAILSAYEKTGWDLGSSTFEGRTPAYPDFEILAEELDHLISTSEYSSEIQSNYRGALLTRVRSLSTGLNRFIFTREQTPFEKLFDQNCILDISRVKSTETKALIMGVIVYLLNEYRADQKSGSNRGLRHITVLEEAHNLLKNTDSSSSELVSKSVSMLTSTIAEIRTYGEGFIIVDQSPSAVDINAIKNTNTKIVLRTPEMHDRETVGKSMGLNEAQINEISKLPSGVAVVCQNDWANPVLTLISKAPLQEVPYKPAHTTRILPVFRSRKILTDLLLEPWLHTDPLSLQDVKDALKSLQLSSLQEKKMREILEDYELMGHHLLWKEADLPMLSNLLQDILSLNGQDLRQPETPAELYDLISSRLPRTGQEKTERIAAIIMKGKNGYET